MLQLQQLSRSTRLLVATTRRLSSVSPPPTSKLVKELLQQIEHDPTFMKKILDKAPNEAVVANIIRPLASHVGRVLDKEFQKADLDGNQEISKVELNNWYKQKFPSFGMEGTMASTAVPASSTGAAAALVAAEEPSSKQLRQLAVMAGIPFIGFGFLDNAIMLVAGNQIEMSLGVAFGVTPLMAAGLGNLMSDVCGLKAGGAIEILAAKLGLPDPGLTVAQLKLASVKRTSLLAGALGISIGCLLGMCPLLFIDVSTNS